MNTLKISLSDAFPADFEEGQGKKISSLGIVVLQKDFLLIRNYRYPYDFKQLFGRKHIYTTRQWVEARNTFFSKLIGPILESPLSDEEIIDFLDEDEEDPFITIDMDKLERVNFAEVRNLRIKGGFSSWKMIEFECPGLGMISFRPGGFTLWGLLFENGFTKEFYKRIKKSLEEMRGGLYSEVEKGRKEEQGHKARERKNWTPYVFLFAVAIFVSTIFMFIYTYFKTGAKSFNSRDPLFLSVTLAIYLISLIIIFITKKVLKCSSCGNLARDLLDYGEGKPKRLCRKHLFEEFKQRFSAFDHRMVVIYPGLEGRKKSNLYVYRYCTREDLRKYGLKAIADLLERGLRSISGTCKKCGADAKVAYFGRGSFKWENALSMIGEISQKAEVLCGRCMLDLIIPSLRKFKGHYSNPIQIPQKGEGILFVFSNRLLQDPHFSHFWNWPASATGRVRQLGKRIKNLTCFRLLKKLLDTLSVRAVLRKRGCCTS